MTRLGINMRNVDDVLTAYHIDVAHDDVGAVQFTNNLEEMRRMVSSKVVSIVSARVGGMPVRLITMHGARDATDQKVSAISPEGKVILHGSILVVGSRKECEDEILCDLTDEQIRYVGDHIGLVDIGKDENKYNTYVLCDVVI